MDEKTAPARRRRLSSGRSTVALVCFILLAASGIIAAHTFHPAPVSAQSPADPVARNRAGPAGFADIVAAVRPAVIAVQSKLADGADPDAAVPSLDRFFREFGGPPHARPGAGMTAMGSAFFISRDGYAVTNNHVIEGSASVTVQTDEQKSYTAKVVGADPVSDLALLKVDGRNDFSYVKLADRMPRVGDWVIAIGNPFGLGGSVTAGIVSARERNIKGNGADDFIQIDAPINKGDSGGPSFDLDGNVVGVNTMIVSPSGGSIGIAFAIPVETVATVVTQLKEKGSVTRG